jgi:hypothetical protein
MSTDLMVVPLIPMVMLPMHTAHMVARLIIIITPILLLFKAPMVALLTPIMVRGLLKPQQVARLVGVMVLAQQHQPTEILEAGIDEASTVINIFARREGVKTRIYALAVRKSGF